VDAAPAAGTPGALAGIRVLDISTLFPGGYLAAMLGDLGADVVKVEPSEGDPLRRTGVHRQGYPTVWTVAGRNKRSIAVDLTGEAGAALVRRLATRADVVVANQPQGILERWGCTYEHLRDDNARVILVWVTGFGADGPDATRAASGTLAEAFAGLTDLLGHAEGPPQLLSIPLGDCMVALAGVNGTLAALLARSAHGGEGQLVDVSMYEAVLPLLATTMAAWAPGSPAPTRSGGRIPGGAPRGTFRSRDGRWIALTGATDGQTRRMLGVIGTDSPENLERFGTSGGRSHHEDALNALIGDWIGARDAEEALAALGSARVPATLVHDLDAVVAHPQVRHRQSVVSVEQPGLGPVTMPGPAPWLTATPAHVARPAPGLGEHTEEICLEWLSATTDELRSWRASGAL
jgi:crotonobetainyl-CoA:carnitine CoA-transferase CaiB-like acyl-CoA transferase